VMPLASSIRSSSLPFQPFAGIWTQNVATSISIANRSPSHRVAQPRASRMPPTSSRTAITGPVSSGKPSMTFWRRSPSARGASSVPGASGRRSRTRSTRPGSGTSLSRPPAPLRVLVRDAGREPSDAQGAPRPRRPGDAPSLRATWRRSTYATKSRRPSVRRKLRRKSLPSGRTGLVSSGAEAGTRTPTPLRALDPETGAGDEPALRLSA
jgi:hypothetical protein